MFIHGTSYSYVAPKPTTTAASSSSSRTSLHAVEHMEYTNVHSDVICLSNVIPGIHSNVMCPYEVHPTIITPVLQYYKKYINTDNWRYPIYPPYIHTPTI